jgi:hypothetical protein
VGIAEPYQYNFISPAEVGKILFFCTGRNRIGHETSISFDLVIPSAFFLARGTCFSSGRPTKVAAKIDQPRSYLRVPSCPSWFNAFGQVNRDPPSPKKGRGLFSAPASRRQNLKKKTNYKKV